MPKFQAVITEIPAFNNIGGHRLITVGAFPDLAATVRVDDISQLNELADIIADGTKGSESGIVHMSWDKMMFSLWREGPEEHRILLNFLRSRTGMVWKQDHTSEYLTEFVYKK